MGLSDPSKFYSCFPQKYSDLLVYYCFHCFHVKFQAHYILHSVMPFFWIPYCIRLLYMVNGLLSLHNLHLIFCSVFSNLVHLELFSVAINKNSFSLLECTFRNRVHIITLAFPFVCLLKCPDSLLCSFCRLWCFLISHLSGCHFYYNLCHDKIFITLWTPEIHIVGTNINTDYYNFFILRRNVY